MAGIGFDLRKLVNSNTLSGTVKAYFHATFATSGPWVFTVFALFSLYSITKDYAYIGYVDEFRAINLYNFCFSLVLTSPFSAVATRYLSDCVYKKNLEPAFGMLVGVLITMFIFVTPLLVYFYFFYATLPFDVSVAASAQFYIISALWVSTVFVSTLKFFNGITIAYLLGMIISVIASIEFAKTNSTTGVLLGFSLGLMFTLACIIALILLDFPKKCSNLFVFLSYFKIHWKLWFGMLFYSLAIWVDKWVMWFSPDAETLSSGLKLYPYYDSAMFMAYLTVIPAMAMFMISVETSFFELYLKYYTDIQKNVSYQQMSVNQNAMLESIISNGRNVIILQGCVAAIAIFIAPYLISISGMNNIQLGMFKFGVLGAAFHVFSLLLIVVLSYFEHKNAVLLLGLFFFVSNGIFTYISMTLGFSFYGYGYFLSTMLTFTLAAIELRRLISRLAYHTFITTNNSI